LCLDGILRRLVAFLLELITSGLVSILVGIVDVDVDVDVDIDVDIDIFLVMMLMLLLLSIVPRLVVASSDSSIALDFDCSFELGKTAILF